MKKTSKAERLRSTPSRQSWRERLHQSCVPLAVAATRAYLIVRWPVMAVLASLFLFAVPSARAESVGPVLITQNVDESKLVTLGGNTRPEAKAKYDRGLVADNLLMEHMLLLLKRSPEQERELEKLIDELHDSSSPNFHRWLTAKEFGERFGVAKPDRDTIKNWLQSHGLKVNVDYTNGLLIDFSGTAGQVREAFHTEIHNLNVKGVKHIANMSDPRIPAALAPAVVGVVSLHDFMPHTLSKLRPNYTFGGCFIGTCYVVVPADLATIYNLNPLFSAGISGQGQTIVVIEDTNVSSTTDWTTFRSTFGLSSYTGGSFTQINPAPPKGANNCTNPGVTGAAVEATVDAEYASAAAPNAAIVLASCSSTATFGGLIALQNLLNESGTPPAIMSISYGECEAVNGAAANAAFNSTYQQAVTEGVSVFVAAGDNGATMCSSSAFEDTATYGIGVSGFTSTPYNVSVGGTDYGDTYAGTNSTYWNAGNSPTYGSAKSYVPEIPWNDSCASSLIAEFNGFSQTYGSSGFCNSSAGESDYISTVSGGGGPSGCATGSPSQSDVVSGTCAGWPKPSWQTLVGNPSDGVRDIPDVSLFAADGVWDHYYLACFTGRGYTCTGAPDTWLGAGGTSFAAPIMAGIQALVNQKADARQGNPNFVYYSLAASQYGASGDSACNSTLGHRVGSSCIFYDVTQGDNDVDCTGTNNCYLPSGTNGVLSTSNSAYQPAYGTTTGWDFATGIGTVNAYNLVNNWPAGFTLTASPSSVTIAQGSNGTSTITITPSNGFSGSVTLSASGLPNGVTAAFSPNPATSNGTLTLTASGTAATGTVTVTITGTSGTLTNTMPLSLTVNAPPSFSLSASPNAVTITQSGQGTSTITITPLNGFSGSVTLSASGLPNGVTAAFSPNPATSSGTLTLTASATAATGTVAVTITGTSGALTKTTTLSLAVQGFSLSASPNAVTITQSGQGTSTITITPLNGFSGSVTLSASGLPNGVTAAFSPNPATTTSTLTLTASATAATGTVAVTITGTSGTLTETTTLSLAVQGFSLSASPNAVTITQGGQGTSTITITPLNGFSGSVTLSASGLPNGVTAAFSPNPATTTSTLTLTASATAATGTVAVTITGTSGALTNTTPLSLTVNAPPNFSLSASPNAVTIAQGGANGTSTITITPVNGFSGNVTLTASGLPKGVTASFSPNPAASTSILTLTASATAATGTVTVTVTGTSGALTKTTTLSLTVNPPPSFSLSASPNAVTITQSGQATSTIAITPLNGFSGSVTLSASGLPNGVTAAFSSNPTTGTSTLTLTASATAATGTVTVTITGTSGALTNTTPLSLTVNAAPNFSLSASPNAVTITQSGQGTSTITITPSNGFSGSVTLSASGLPSGVTAAFSSNPTTGTSTLTLTASGSATTAAATVTITGTSGSLTATTTLALTVNQAFTVPATLTAPTAASPGQSTSTTMSISTVGGSAFTSNVTYALSGLPAGATYSFSPTQISANAASPATVTITVQTAGPFTGSTAGARHKLLGDKQRLWLPLSLPLAGMLLVGLAGRGLPRRYKIVGLCLAMALTGFLVACGGGGGSTSAPVIVTVSPSTVNTLYPNLTDAPPQTVNLTATVSNTTNQAVTWAITANGTNDSVTSTGTNTATYTAPTAVPPGVVTVTATSQTATTATGNAAITIKTPTPAGTYPVTVTVTEGSIQHTTGFSLQVN